MGKEVKINKLTDEDAEPAMSSLEIVVSNSGRDKHLEGLSEDQKEVIKSIANIFVKSVLNLSEK